jgi:DNA end-binding protein Ku
MRAFWAGELTFGLVTIPVKLYTATRDLTPQFRLLHKECGTPIVTVRRCPKHERDLAWDEIGKGYPVGKDEYALFTKEELAKLEGDDSGGAIEIVEFVDPLEVDNAYVEKSYWVGPSGKNVRGYQLLRSVLQRSKRVALAKVRLRTRTRLALVRPRGQLFALDLMRFAEELQSADEITLPEEKETSAREMRLAEHLVEELSGPFDPAKVPDDYRQAVLAAAEEKVEAGEVARGEDGGAPERPSAATGGRVVSLADLLSRSLEAGARPGPAKAQPARAAGRKADRAGTMPKGRRATASKVRRAAG